MLQVTAKQKNVLARFCKCDFFVKRNFPRIVPHKPSKTFRIFLCIIFSKMTRINCYATSIPCMSFAIQTRCISTCKLSWIVSNKEKHIRLQWAISLSPISKRCRKSLLSQAPSLYGRFLFDFQNFYCYVPCIFNNSCAIFFTFSPVKPILFVLNRSVLISKTFISQSWWYWEVRL